MILEDLIGQWWFWIVASIVAFFAGIGIVYGLDAVSKWLKSKADELGEDEWDRAYELLGPFIDQVIVAVFKLSEAASDEVGKRLDEVDKVALADALYDMALNWTQDNLPTWAVTLIFNFLTRERWHGMVEERFQGLIDLWQEKSSELLDLLRPDAPTSARLFILAGSKPPRLQMHTLKN
uniref:Uncharacterized protein n=1 Tax=viral metagenome TaxID=1070528 RepID=A0A6M3KFF8_9ZZZZ